MSAERVSIWASVSGTPRRLVCVPCKRSRATEHSGRRTKLHNGVPPRAKRQFPVSCEHSLLFRLLSPSPATCLCFCCPLSAPSPPLCSLQQQLCTKRWGHALIIIIRAPIRIAARTQTPGRVSDTGRERPPPQMGRSPAAPVVASQVFFPHLQRWFKSRTAFTDVKPEWTVKQEIHSAYALYPP